MDKKALAQLLQQVASQNLSVEAALAKLDTPQTADLGFAKVDLARQQRTGYPETIFGAGKTARQIIAIIQTMQQESPYVLCTRVDAEKAAAVQAEVPAAQYDVTARCLVVGQRATPKTDQTIAIVTAGTSDLPVAEEAALTAEVFGNHVTRVFDVGVAGIQRLFDQLDVIRAAQVVIVVAGMEGALASVVGGLVDKPVIALPTSVGYGSSFQGLSALLTMLNSCAEGVSVVNIDNGFGAGYCASVINQLGVS
ncbi:nickel pincer cofactor biosynthesis protein LarB [Lactiplantibacillus daowaiensis]|uniref:Nickel pincer cofactor biosynthesis protein LarB n=1 Tax=Lactiplantibacillus daowaiensis TaxID=2559918 RepID=A0ABW1RWF6_9LACO|nr:nickel pincer cofactor biosynthesis protein LarB [Lactiplantibacillus daowaiensis]